MSQASGASLNPQTAFGRNTSTLLWVDRHLGVPACWLLTGVRRLLQLGEKSAAEPARNILFLKLAEQGSTVLAYAALRAAVARVGRDRVYFLVFEENRFVVDVLGLIPEANVLTIRTRSAWSMLTSALGRLGQVRKLGIDACIDMEFFTRSSAALAFLTGARQRVGFHAYFGEGPYRGDLFTHRVLYNPHLHTSRTFATLVQALELDPARLPTFPFVPPASAVPPLLQSSPEEVAAMREILQQLGMPAEGRLVLLNANASDLLPLRRWNERNYVELARRLLAEFPDLYVGFTGAPDEAAAIAGLAGAVASPQCLRLAGRTSLRQLLVVYGLAEVLVTNDSGPAHFASLTPIDVVALFGPETPLLFAGLGPRNHPLWAGIACSPCVSALNNRQTACRDNVCMQGITLDQVLATVRGIYLRRTIPQP